LPPVGPPLQGTAVRADAAGGAEVRAPGYIALVEGHRLRSFCAPGGPELLAEAPSHSFCRATTDNDRCGLDFFVPWAPKLPLVRGILRRTGNLSFAAVWRMVGLDRLQSLVDTCEWSSAAEGPMLHVRERFVVDGRTCFRAETWLVFGPADVALSVRVSATGPAWRVASLPRVGLHLAAPSQLSRLCWLGCGPGECYPDRKAASDWAVHCRDVDSLHVDYLVPSESGGKADVHWAALTDPQEPGSGLLISYCSDDTVPVRERPSDQASGRRPASTQGAQLSTSRWTLAELDAARHHFELPDRQALRSRPVQVHVDTAHAGIGGAGEGGAKLWATASQFLINPKESPWSYTVRLQPLTPGTWRHSGQVDE